MIARGGIDLGGTKIQTIVLDGRNKVRGQARRPTPTDGGPADVAAEMAGAMADAVEAAGLGKESLQSVGVGSPGEVDAKKGIVSQARNLPGWEGSFPLAAELKRLTGAPVWLGNDVQVATDAEFHLGAGKPYDSLLMVSWGTGVGGGVVLNGKPWLGRGTAGEIGHMVIKEGGAKCPCGRRGCVEAYAGRAAMEARARELHKRGHKTDLFKIMEQRGRDRLTSGIWGRALKHEDKLAHHVVERALRALGAGVGSAVNLLDVEAVIVGGGLGVRFGEPYVERIRKEMLPHVFASERPPEVRLASLGDLGGATGAALLPETSSA